MIKLQNFNVSVFTPTFNRAHTLNRVYGSLLNQSIYPYEWIIVDDGSTDDTKVIVEQWIINAPFKIIYVQKPNEGKHIAINRGVQLATGDLFLIFDSDDACLPESLAFFRKEWEKIQKQENRLEYSGITVRCLKENGEPYSDEVYPVDGYDSNHLEIEFTHKLKSETWTCYSTDILKKYPFPEELKQTYVGEGLIWRKIALHYKMRYFNKALRVYYSDQEGITNHKGKAKNKLGQIYTGIDFYNNYCKFGLKNLPVFTKSLIVLVESSLHQSLWYNTFINLKSKFLKLNYLLATPFGIVLFLKNKSRLNLKW